ncbi:SDR family NAD(P)-dependent oxidoreductase [Perlabentimonas gracilis]|uniref:SDR family NAD(P)-dependent oxidoreductase n=1 Tax=Perlabentimonas gracilis TaxID=2715279 RepID=UPI00140D4641|nr:SDR family NAD(P)-dependent oxidoreductase [Perlabentimonas gracilis]NHB69124.1 SDR family NAD(P)-dependent oxidoreductase [Perlabentimonas gracilis]
MKKIVIITGANSGIGKEAALRFAIDDFNVVMACRNIQKSEKVRDEIIRLSGNSNVRLMMLDMASFNSIKEFTDRFKEEYPKLDILINNAGYFEHGAKYKLSENGIELTFATNAVGPFLLTTLLIDSLKKSDDPRVLNASSNIIKHFFSPKKQIDFANLQGIKDKGYKHSVYNSYRNSKIALLMLTFRMAKKYEESNVKFFSLQINGARMSKETLRKFKMPWRLVAHIQNLFFPHPSYMANNYFEICTSAKYKDITGKHFNDKLEVMKVAPENPALKDILGTSVYPVYADRKDEQEAVIRLCEELASEYFIQ